MKIFATDVRGPLTNSDLSLIKTNPGVLATAVAKKEAVEEITRWVFDGLVPSIVTRDSLEFRFIYEVWLTRNNVPYSNFLMGADRIDLALRYLDASFYITSDTDSAVDATKASPDINVYFLRRLYAKPFEDNILADDELKDRITFVNSFKEVAEAERV